MPGQIVIVGGGAAGFFAAIAAAQSPGAHRVTVLERSSQFLAKVKISGGGRCNVTNVLDDPVALSRHYPRGERALISAFHRFSSTDTVAWFEKRGIPLKTEADGRIFPRSDSSASIVGCLLGEAESAGVHLRLRCGLESVERLPTGFRLTLTANETMECDRLLLATGGCRAAAAGNIAASLGHRIEAPVPSLFSFHATGHWLSALPGVSLPDVAVNIPGTKLRQRGPLLVTHHGLSGPVILKLSAWGARDLHAVDYSFRLQINWMPEWQQDELAAALSQARQDHPKKLVVNSPLGSLPSRLWESLCHAAGISSSIAWTNLGRGETQVLLRLLAQTEVSIDGKSLNKDEFVTCGGVSLKEIDFRTMQSRLVPGLFFAGELLDLDGVTGGFNFQSAWTTGWIAGQAMTK